MRTDTQLSFQIRRMVPLEVRAVSTFLFLQLSSSILHCICCFHSVFLLYTLFTLFAFVHVSAFLHFIFVFCLSPPFLVCCLSLSFSLTLIFSFSRSISVLLLYLSLSSSLSFPSLMKSHSHFSCRSILDRLLADNRDSS